MNVCLRMDTTYKPEVKTKGFYSKNAKYKKKKIRSLLFPCTVFHSDKTSRLHTAQNSPREDPEGTPSRTAFHTSILYTPVSDAPPPGPARAKSGRGPAAGGELQQLSPPESRHPTNRASPPRKVPKSEEERRKRNYGSSCGSSEQEGNQINK